MSSSTSEPAWPAAAAKGLGYPERRIRLMADVSRALLMTAVALAAWVALGGSVGPAPAERGDSGADLSDHGLAASVLTHPIDPTVVSGPLVPVRVRHALERGGSGRGGSLHEGD